MALPPPTPPPTDDDDDDDDDGDVVRNGSPADGDSESESLADDAISPKDWACQSSVRR